MKGGIHDFPLFEKDASLNKELSNGLNLKCVKLEVFDTYKVISMNPHAKETNSPITIFNKPNQNSEKDVLQQKKSIFTVFFSLFLGKFKIDEMRFLVFVSKVRPIRIGRYEVYKVLQISVYEEHSHFPDIDLSKIMTDLFCENSHFSFTLDLTQPFPCAYQKIHLNSNPFFSSSVNLIMDYLTQNDMSWHNALVLGNIVHSKINDEELLFIFKISTLDINPYCHKDLNIFANFYAPTSIKVYEFIILKNDELQSAIEFSLSNYPAIFSFVNDDNEKLEKSNFNPNNVYKFGQFFNEFFDCKNFLAAGSSSTRKLFKKISKYVSHNNEQDNNSCIIEKFISISDGSSDDDIIANVTEFVKSQGNVVDSSKGRYFYLNFALICDIKENEIEHLIMTIFENVSKNKKLINFYGETKIDDFFEMKTNSLKIPKFEQTNFRIKTGFEKSRAISLRKHITLNKFFSFDSIFTKIFGEKHFLSIFISKIIQRANQAIFTTKNVQISLITHNCSGVVPTSSAELDYLFNQKVRSSDILVINLQEILEMKSKNIKNIVTNENNKETIFWENFFIKHLSDFMLIGSSSMLGLMMLIFVNKKIENKIEITLDKAIKNKLGFMNVFANKGFISLKLKIDYESITLFNCHFESGNSKEDYYKRIEHLNSVFNQLLSKTKSPVGFISGDLNFRNICSTTELEKILVDLDNDNNRSRIVEKLSEFDQLQTFFKNEDLNKRGIYEPKINFLPTYKLIPQSGRYNSQQILSWSVYKD